VVATSANVHDSRLLGDILHQEETTARGGSPYAGRGDDTAEHAPGARECTKKKGSSHRSLSDRKRASNRNKSKLGANVGDVFGMMESVSVLPKSATGDWRRMPITYLSPAQWSVDGRQDIIENNETTTGEMRPRIGDN
jgi:hypothetical protein